MITISELYVFRVSPNKDDKLKEEDIIGGSIDVTETTNRIFAASFDGKIGRSIKFQPFHFKFEGETRVNPTRDLLIEFISRLTVVDRAKVLRKIALRLTKMIDNRTGELLLTVAYGKDQEQQKIAIWAYPRDDPIQLTDDKGIPKIAEIQNAFSKSSYLRKAVYFEEPLNINRNCLLKGKVIDASAGRTNIATNYWLSAFIFGIIDLLSTRGTTQILKALKSAQQKAQTVQEKSSIASVIHALLAKSVKDTTINEIDKMLVGEPQKEFIRQFEKGIELDARFSIDYKEVAAKIKSTIIKLTNGIEVYFPVNESIDYLDYISEKGGKKILIINEEIDSELFK